MTTEITREQAVKESLEMWEWLRDNPDKTKKGYLNKFKPNEEIMCGCYFCEYSHKEIDDIHSLDCNICPAYGLWGSETTELAIKNGYFCEQVDKNGNPTVWRKYSREDKDINLRKQYAGAMVELIKKIDV